eukprot:6762090-Ditylum_brightwellii.AAC.1
MECKACEFRPAVVMVVDDEMVEGDGCPLGLCHTCFSDLHYEYDTATTTAINVEGSKKQYKL